MAPSLHRAALAAAVLALAALLPPRAARGTTVDMSTLGSYQAPAVQQAGLALRPEVNLPLLNILQWNGVGVVGGASDNTLDPGEALLFTFASPATSVSLFVQFGQDADGDGLFAEAWVEGYGADGKLVGVGSVNGVGAVGISTLFGGVPLSRLRVVPRDGDRLRVYSASFTTGGSTHTVDLSALGSFKATGVQQAGLTLGAEVNVPLLNVLTYNGVGVVGGASNNTLDPGESLLFTFASPAVGVSYFVQFGQDVDGDGYFAEATVEGYGADGTIVGVSPVSGVGSVDVSTLFGGVPLSAFRVLTRDNERQRVYSVTFDRRLDVEDGPRPEAIALRLAGRNPVRGDGVLAFELPLAGRVDLSLYDLQGRRVREIASGVHSPGVHRASFDSRDLQAGVYFAVLAVEGNARTTVKVNVLK